jgi:hypothetical protein
MTQLDLVKGYNLVDCDTEELNGYIQEGSPISIKLITGEIKQGIMTKPAKKQFLLTHDGITEVIRVGDVIEMEVVEE